MSITLKNVNLIGIDYNFKNKESNLIINDQGMVYEKGKDNGGNKNNKVLDLSDYYLSPGWIDLHTHIYYGVSNIGLDPDRIGPATGVTTLVDAGSAGEVNFLGLKKYIIEPKFYNIFSFINIGSIGLVYANDISEFDHLGKLNLDSLVDCIENNKEYIKGVKLRASGVILKEWGMEAVKLAKKVSREVNLPLVVHVGEPLPLLEDILPVLEEGDVLTHCYHGKRWGIFENDNFIPGLKDAVDRGVKLDIGHGKDSFNFNVAEKAISRGLKPFSISTDLHQQNVKGPVYNLPLTMSKMLALGLSLKEVIKKVTKNPAEIIDLDLYQNELIGKKANFTIFKIIEEEMKVTDSNGNHLNIKNNIVPEYTIIGNKIIKVNSI